jgi:anti-anti-sigma factor
VTVELRQERFGGVLVLTPSGRLDNESAVDFELAAQELLAAGERHLVVDLSHLNYISNAGLRVLANTGKALDSPATSLRLAGLSPALRQVFDAAGFSAMFDIHADRATALARHPAGSVGSELGALAAHLLGCERDTAAAVPEPDRRVARLAELALELLSTARQPRAARALAEGTRLVPRVQVAVPEGQPPPARGWLGRMFGRTKQAPK